MSDLTNFKKNKFSTIKLIISDLTNLIDDEYTRKESIYEKGEKEKKEDRKLIRILKRKRKKTDSRADHRRNVEGGGKNC